MHKTQPSVLLVPPKKGEFVAKRFEFYTFQWRSLLFLNSEELSVKMLECLNSSGMVPKMTGLEWQNWNDRNGITELK